MVMLDLNIGCEGILVVQFSDEKLKRNNTHYEKNEAYQNLTDKEWAKLMEDIGSMKQLMAKISFSVSLIKQKKGGEEKEKKQTVQTNAKLEG
eukprot:UN04134